MPSITETGFVSLEQEEFLRKNQPELYKYILKKFGSFGKKKNPNLGNTPTINPVMTKRRGT